MKAEHELVNRSGGFLTTCCQNPASQSCPHLLTLRLGSSCRCVFSFHFGRRAHDLDSLHFCIHQQLLKCLSDDSARNMSAKISLLLLSGAMFFPFRVPSLVLFCQSLDKIMDVSENTGSTTTHATTPSSRGVGVLGFTWRTRRASPN